VNGARLAAAAALAAVMAGGAGAAEARWFDLHAGIRAGGIVGWGTQSNTPDFFDKTSGGAAGFELGAKLLVFDVSANFLQVLNSDGRVGTLTQFLAGVKIDVPVGRAKMPDGKSRNIIRPGLVGGFGLGTPGPVHPPLSNDQISDKGVVSQAEIAWEYFLNPFVAVGLEGDAGYHYFLGGQVVTNNADHSSGYHLIGLGTLTFHLGI
jgi:hypothetical protein